MRGKGRERNKEWVSEIRVSFVGRGHNYNNVTVKDDRWKNSVMFDLRQEGRQNRRNASVISSFYFTRFLDDVGEKELWWTFKKWGGIREVFIVRNRNMSGRRYGFVRFKGVADVRLLER